MITLISPRLAIQKGDFLGSGVPYWPVELAVFAAFLISKGESVSVIDLFGDGVRDVEEKKDYFLQGRPLSSYFNDARVKEASCFVVFALSAMSHAELLEIVRELKSHSRAPVVVLENSQAVTAYAVDQEAGDFFAAGVDALLCGEPYWNWPEIDAFIKRGFTGEAPANVVVAATPEARAPKRIYEKEPTYPMPAWDLFNREGYWSLPYSHGPRTKRFFPILTSRGCPYPCDFCVVPQTNNMRWRGRAASDVVEEMLALQSRYGVSDFQIEDLNPTVSKARTQEICELLIRRGANVRFYLVSGTKAETVPVEQVPLLARAGCRYISISPESGSAAVMKQIGKPFDYEHGLRLVRACREHGISTQACFVVGYPTETAEDHAASRRYLDALVKAGLDEAAFFILSPLPGSKLERGEKLSLDDPTRLLSFSPKGRSGWEVLEKRRSELIRRFFSDKIRYQPFALAAQGFRALFGTPRTKMENLPRRVLYVKNLLKARKR